MRVPKKHIHDYAADRKGHSGVHEKWEAFPIGKRLMKNCQKVASVESKQKAEMLKEDWKAAGYYVRCEREMPGHWNIYIYPRSRNAPFPVRV